MCTRFLCVHDVGILRLREVNKLDVVVLTVVKIIQ